MKTLILILALCSISCQHQKSAGVAGPIPIKSQALSALVTPAPIAEDTDVLSSGSFDTRISQTYANYFVDYVAFFLDLETKDNQAQFRLGLPFFQEISFGQIDKRVTKTRMDHMIEEFHKVISVDDRSRNSVPRDHSQVFIPELEIDWDDDESRGRISQHRHLQWKTQLIATKSFRMSAAYDFADFYSRFWSQKSQSQTWRLFLKFVFGNHSYQLNGSISDLTRPENSYPYPDDYHTGFFSYENNFTNNQTFIFQFHYYEQVDIDIGQLTAPAFEFSFGYRLFLKPIYFDVAVLENIFYHKNSSDLSLHYGVGARF